MQLLSPVGGQAHVIQRGADFSHIANIFNVSDAERLLFYASPGAIDDLEELAVGAESKGLFNRIAKRNNGRERLPLL